MPLEDRVIGRIDRLIERANAVIETYRPNPPEYGHFPTLNDSAFMGWRVQTLSFLTNLLGCDHVYVEEFRKQVESGFVDEVKIGQSVLLAVKEEGHRRWFLNRCQNSHLG